MLEAVGGTSDSDVGFGGRKGWLSSPCMAAERERRTEGSGWRWKAAGPGSVRPTGGGEETLLSSVSPGRADFFGCFLVYFLLP